MRADRPPAAGIGLGPGLRRHAPIPSDAGPDLRKLLAGQPRFAAAPAKSGDRQLARLDECGVLQERDGRADITHYLRIRGLSDDPDHRRHVAERGRVGDAHEESWGQGDVAQLGEPPAHIADIFMQAEDFADHDHRRKPTPGSGSGQIGRQGKA